MTEKNCLFCKIAKREIKSEVVGESNNFIAFKDINPVSEGHTLVVPKKHYVTLLDIPNTLGEEMIKMIKDVSGNLLEEKKGDGFNVLMNNLFPAGQLVMHAHVHIIPRKEGDGIKIIHK